MFSWPHEALQAFMETLFLRDFGSCIQPDRNEEMAWTYDRGPCAKLVTSFKMYDELRLSDVTQKSARESWFITKGQKQNASTQMNASAFFGACFVMSGLDCVSDTWFLEAFKRHAGPREVVCLFHEADRAGKLDGLLSNRHFYCPLDRYDFSAETSNVSHMFLCLVC